MRFRNLMGNPVIAIFLLISTVAWPPVAAESPGVLARIAAPDEASFSDLKARLFELTPTGDVILREEIEIGSELRFEAFLPSEGALLEVTAEGFGRRLRWLSPHRDHGTEVTFVLPSRRQEASGPTASPVGTRLLGRAIDASGRPIAGVTVQVARLDFKTLTALPIAFRNEDGNEGLRASAGPDGRFEVELRRRIELPRSDDAAFEVVCTAPGFAVAASPIQKHAEQEVVCRMTSERMAISGRLGGADLVLDAPLPVQIFVRTDGAPVAETLLSDRAGRFASRPHFPRGAPHVVILNNSDYRPQMRLVSPHQNEEIKLPLEPGVGLDIEVRDAETGQWIESARVRALLKVGPLPLERAAIPTASLHHLPNLPPENEFGLEVDADGYSSKTVRAMAVPRAGPLVVELEPASILRVRVQDASGRPVATARVTVAPDRAARSNIEARLRGIDVTQHTDSDGAAVLEGLVLMPSFRVSCDAEGFAPWWQDGIRLRAGTQDLTITLDRGALIEGQVLHEDGHPVENAIVQALLVAPNPDDPKHFFATPEAQTEALSEADGRYRLENLVAGTYLITTELPSGDRIGEFMIDDPLPPLPLVEGDVLQGLDFYLRTPGRLRLYPPAALADEAQPRVTFYDRAEGVPFLGRVATAAARTDTDGSFIVEDIAPGTYDIEVRIAGAIPNRFEEIDIAGWGETPLTLDETTEGGELLVRVLDPFGLPAAGVRAELYPVTANELRAGHDGKVTEIPENHPDLVSGTADQNGEILFTHLEDTKYQLHVTSDEGGYGYETFTLSRHQFGKRLEKEILLREGIQVPIRIESLSGVPVVQAYVSLTRTLEGFSGHKIEGSTNDRGEARLFPLQAGTYQAEVFLGRALVNGLRPSRGDAIHRQPLVITDSTLKVLLLP